MKILHRITFNESNKNEQIVRKQLLKIGIEFNQELLNFEVEESSPYWREISKLLSKYNAVDIVRTIFTEKEKQLVSWLRVFPSWENGYPQPEDDFSYKSFTYDLSDSFCQECGCGYKQKAPFQILKEPSWGTKHIFRLHWVPDAFFVRKEFFSRVLEPLGIDSYPVLKYGSNIELKTVVQIKIEHELNVEPNLQNSLFEFCQTCNRKKYMPIRKGLLPTIDFKNQQIHLHLIKSKEYYGSGGEAYKLIYCSQELYQILKNNKIKGVEFHPVDQN